MAGPRKKTKHFVNNDEMFAKVCKYKAQCERAERYGAPRPGVPKSLAKDIEDIAESLSHRHNFRNYPFRKDMMQDGIEHVLRYIHSFDTDKFKNVFGWVSLILWQCYGNRIKTEKRQLYLKFKAGMDFYHEMRYLVDGGGAGPSIAGVDVQFINDFIEEFETKNVKKSESKTKAKVDNEE